MLLAENLRSLAQTIARFLSGAKAVKFDIETGASRKAVKIKGV